MNEKRKFKKLVLKKEEIVNLNDYQMGQMKGGGSTWGCFIASVSFCYEIGKDVYSAGKDASMWNCTYSKQENCMTDISKKIVNLPDGSRACELPEVFVYGYRPYGYRP